MSQSQPGCSNCAKNSCNLLKCSRCGLSSYCGQECQKKHWKIHKKSCKCFVVKSIPGKGFGMVATRNIKQGEIIIAEDPILFLQNDEENMIASLDSQFKNLSSENQKKVTALHDPDPSGDIDQKLRRIFKINCIEVNYVGGGALYPTIPRINHSCSPNAVWSWKKGNAKRKEVRALRKISEGDEICSNYIDDVETNYNTKKARQASLQRWHFVCTCPVCSLPVDKLPENDKIRSEIRAAHFQLPSLLSCQDLLGCVAAAQKKLNLLLRLDEELLADLPAAYMEAYEFMAIAKALKYDIKEDPEFYRQKAQHLAGLFGDKFVNEYQVKLNDILYGS